MDGRILDSSRTLALCASVALLAACSGCSEVATLSVDQGSGPQPVLPAPKKTLIPTLKVAPAVHWREGEKPNAAPGLQVGAFATGLDHPLLDCETAILMPHVGSGTHATRARMSRVACENILAVLQGQRPRFLVNPDAWEKRRR